MGGEVVQVWVPGAVLPAADASLHFLCLSLHLCWHLLCGLFVEAAAAAGLVAAPAAVEYSWQGKHLIRVIDEFAQKTPL